MFQAYKNFFIFFHPLGIIAPFIFLIRGIKEDGFVMESDAANYIIGCVGLIILWGSIAVYVFNFTEKHSINFGFFGLFLQV